MHTHNFPLQLFSILLSWLCAFVGIIMISHDREFYSLVCPEVWEVADGHTKGVFWCTRNENELYLLMLPPTFKQYQWTIFPPGHGSITKQIHVHSIFSSLYFIVDSFDSSNIFLLGFHTLSFCPKHHASRSLPPCTSKERAARRTRRSPSSEGKRCAVPEPAHG